MPNVRRALTNSFLKRALSYTSVAQKNPVINTENGQLRGRANTDWKGGRFYSFQGIPYAKPPLGEFRFKDAIPAEPWIGVKDATKEGSICYSRHLLSLEIGGSEDCLYLNVYSPELSSNLKPVMVWIHGGGFTVGSSNTDLYGPEFLVSEDVVVVTINYRLGLLGFANFEDPALNVPGNAGLKDQILALKWVQKNISKFGGDPSNVTIFGQSAGGSSVHYLMLSPFAKGLFHRAIAQSGTALNMFAEGQCTAKVVARALKLNSVTDEEVLKMLSKMTTIELHKLQEKIPDRFIVSERRPFGPMIDASFLLDKPASCINDGKFNKVPFIIGYTSKEGMLVELIIKRYYRDMKIHKDISKNIPYLMNISRDNQELINNVASEIQEYYYGKLEPTLDNLLPFYLLNGDNHFLREINKTVELHTRCSSAPVYYYRMSLDTKLNFMKILWDIRGLGACHGDDLGYLFKNYLTPDIQNNSMEAISVRRCCKLWANFARYGDPTPKQSDDRIVNVHWKSTEIGKLHFMDIGENLTMGVNPEAEQLKFWDELFDKYSVKQ